MKIYTVYHGEKIFAWDGNSCETQSETESIVDVCDSYFTAADAAAQYVEKRLVELEGLHYICRPIDPRVFIGCRNRYEISFALRISAGSRLEAREYIYIDETEVE